MRTPLYGLHVAAKAKMIDFAGWQMPVQYTSIIEEHQKVRQAAGIFDISHMGRIYVSGKGAASLLQLALTNDVLSLAVGQSHYSLLCNPQGGIKDDVLVYRLAESEYLLVTNASNREKVLAWLGALKDERVRHNGFGETRWADRTLETAMIAVQGPASPEVLQPLTNANLAGLKYYRSEEGSFGAETGLISRTGYTGEDGFEVILPAEAGIRLWEQLAAEARAGKAALAGLGARDTLRLEAGLPLYGHELDESVNPYEVGLGRFVRPDKGAFVGRDALQRVAEAGPRRRLTGLTIPDGAIARQGTPVQLDGRVVGSVTSGNRSPSLRRSIAMALVETEVAERTGLSLVVRDKAHPAEVTALPFYRRPKPAVTKDRSVPGHTRGRA
ncbi:MAG: glycine cleavage system aminomethyltransferase GcvT [Dehalococcoidales bacterium]|nr:glycine cleavage system aminomethyltransferase GcvT [Dehalococcoidales bacterium]